MFIGSTQQLPSIVFLEAHSVFQNMRSNPQQNAANKTDKKGVATSSFSFPPLVSRMKVWCLKAVY